MSYCITHNTEYLDGRTCTHCYVENENSIRKACGMEKLSANSVITGAAMQFSSAVGGTADSVQVGGSHYKDMPMQPWEVMEAVLTPEEFRGFLKGNVIKYSMRAGKKEGSDDAGKAQHYKAKLMEVTK